MRETAVVKWFDNAKGFGFLTDSEGRDVFIHYSTILVEGYKHLESGDEVEYTPTCTHKGISATEVAPKNTGPKLVVIPLEPKAAVQVLRTEFTTAELDQIVSALR